MECEAQLIAVREIVGINTLLKINTKLVRKANIPFSSFIGDDILTKYHGFWK
jgi:hypothetical protein